MSKTETISSSEGERRRRAPRVRVTEADLERLTNLAESQSGPGARLLAEELDRATVVGEGQARGFVRLYSTVTYAEQASGATRTVQIVPPDEADIDAGRLSVLAPVGAALIGLAAGAAFAWRGQDGRLRELRVLEVSEASAAP